MLQRQQKNKSLNIEFRLKIGSCLFKTYFFGVEGLPPLEGLVAGGLLPRLPPDGFPVLLGQFLFELLIF